MTGLARNDDGDTAHAAASSFDGAALEGIVLNALKQYPAGLTVDALVEVTGLQKVTVSPRLAPLTRKGLVGTNGKAPGASGRAQTVWVAI